MKKHSANERNNGTGLRSRFGTKAVTAIATFALVASMCPGTAALAYANEQLAAGPAESGLAAGAVDLQAQGDDGGNTLSAQADDFIEVTENTHQMWSGRYRVSRDVTINPGSHGNGIRINYGAKVYLYIEKGATLTVKGEDGTLEHRGYAAIRLGNFTTLIVYGEGTLNATGGKAGDGRDGGSARAGEVNIDGNVAYTGKGGSGGYGGFGAGAGIGTNGGRWGDYGVGGSETDIGSNSFRSNTYGKEGNNGEVGQMAEDAGTLIVTGSVTVNAQGGAPGTGGKAGNRGGYREDRTTWIGTAVGTSGGGGGGGGGSAADGIGSGGTGGGGGGGGASGNIDGEAAIFKGCDLDDLWGHGGSGGASAWGGGVGSRGDEGASNGGDSTSLSTKYAKSGGEGGPCPTPKTVTFYTYKAPGTSGPTVNCTSGHGVTRVATSLGTLKAFTDLGGRADMVSGGGSYEYDGKKHGASVGNTGSLSAQSEVSSALVAQADGDTYAEGESAEGAVSLRAQADDEADEEWPDSGTVEIDGYTVDYSITYYDEVGNDIGSAPTLPGQYVAVVSFKARDPEAPEDYTGDWAEPITITKRQVAKPTPAELVFECADWETGEGAEQDAFAGLDDDLDDDGKPDFEFISNATADDGAPSLRSAKAAGSYQACFELADPDMCQWEDEPEDAARAWVPWSIKLVEFDPNDVMYWGPAYDEETTTVAYTGEPQWVRPWFTYAKDADGKFPAWFTHWGSDDRPSSDKSSAVVVYLQGDDDEQGLVGYHTGADGTLEPVTGAQVYAWVNGVDVGGEHLAVQSGEKVWYKTGEDGWWEPLAVQDDEPEGAEGYVVARDYAYADRLGVMEPGTYQAYALFDSGAGFAPTALAEATVEVTPADATATKAAPAKASAPKTGDSPLLATAGGIALVALLAAGALALASARRRS